MLRWLCLVMEERPTMLQLPMKSCCPCVSVTRMRDGDKGSPSGVHAAEQTLPFAPERASGFGKTGETHSHPQLIQYPITAAHQSQGAPRGTASSWHHKPPLPSPLAQISKTLALSPREPHTPPCQETDRMPLTYPTTSRSLQDITVSH